MKVAVFAGYFYPHKGGYEKYILELYSRLVEKGLDIKIITCKTGNELFEENYRGLEILRFDSWQLLGGTYPVPKINKNFFNIIKKIKHWSPDIVNTQTRFFLTSFIGLLFSKIYKKILVHTEHGTSFVKLSNPINNLISRIYDYTLGYLTISLANKVVTISQAAANFSQKLGAKNLSIIYNGIDLEKFKKITDVNRSNYQLSSRDYVITFIGRIIKAKGIEDLLWAFDKIRLDNAKLLIIGMGNDYDRIKKLASANKNIILLGEKDEKEIIKILSITDLFVNPSYSEGLPTSVLEAVAIGCNIVATEVGGTNEILEKKYLFKAGDRNELINKIQERHNDNDVPSYDIDKFSWHNIVAKYIELLDQIK